MSSAHADGCVLVIFGASGDLTRRKLLPSVYNLSEAKLLPEQFAVLGVARPPMDDTGFRTQMREQARIQEGAPLESDKWQRIERALYYLSGDFGTPDLYDSLKQKLEDIRSRHAIPPNYLFYLAIPPELFATVVGGLAKAGLTNQRDGWRRVIVEKPFGYDLESARALNASLAAALDESQIYRIDHYLGKETVQNILAFRFANGIFEPIWNRRYVDHVQMTVAEEDGVGTRAGYYDKAGALRDIVQNHLFQLLSLAAMEPPNSFSSEDVRNEKVKVLHAVQPLGHDEVRRYVVRAQYGGDAARKLPAYREEPKVPSDSRTETYVALRVIIDNWRWSGVPFYLRTGKRMAHRVTELVITFKPAPFVLFRGTSVACLNPNVLVLRIQPDEGISLGFDAKAPGPLERLETVTMDFSYAKHFKTEPMTGYETLLFDAMMGDQTLFLRMDMVEAGWQIVEPILKLWKEDTRAPLPLYDPGSWGPPEADVLIEHDRREWHQS